MIDQITAVTSKKRRKTPNVLLSAQQYAKQRKNNPSRVQHQSKPSQLTSTASDKPEGKKKKRKKNESNHKIQ